MKQKRRLQRTREQIAQEAARIMHEQSLRDFRQAKKKACERLGIPDKASMPGNDEIQQALTDYLRLFKSNSQPQLIKRLRQAALEAMQFLSDFDPRLVGSVLHGTADDYAPVQLHVFADPPERILHYLLQHDINHQLSNRRIQYCDDRIDNITVCECMAGAVSIELMLFNRTGLREAPRSPIDGKPMQRINKRELEKLIGDY